MRKLSLVEVSEDLQCSEEVVVFEEPPKHLLEADHFVLLQKLALFK